MLRRVCVFSACGYTTAAVENNTAGQSIILRYGTAGCAQWPQLLGGGTWSPLYLIGDAASRRGLSRVGYFIPLNGPLSGHPPSVFYSRQHCLVLPLVFDISKK